MKLTHSTIETREAPDGLAKRLFLLAMLGVLAYIGVVILLMTSVD